MPAATSFELSLALPLPEGVAAKRQDVLSINAGLFATTFSELHFNEVSIGLELDKSATKFPLTKFI